MSFPLPPNTTADVYRGANAPPAPPDVAGVKGYLQPRGRNIHVQPNYTHWMDVPLATDVRGVGVADNFYIPDLTGTHFNVVGVERIRSGAGGDFKRVYLQRQAVTWPSNNL